MEHGFQGCIVINLHTLPLTHWTIGMQTSSKYKYMLKKK